MEPLELLRQISRTIRPNAQKLIAEEKLAGSEAHLRALGDMLDNLSKADTLTEREMEIMDALWAVYRRVNKNKKPGEAWRNIGKSEILDELGERMTYGELTWLRAMQHLRDDLHFIKLDGKNWKPLVDPHDLIREAAAKVPGLELLVNAEAKEA